MEQLKLEWSRAQQPKWDDVRLPEEYHEFFLATHQCLNCRRPLRDSLHAFYHFKKWHIIKVHRFFVWRGARWDEVKFPEFIKAVKRHQPVAHTHPARPS